MNLPAIHHVAPLLLANGEIVGAVFAVLFVLLHIVNAIKKEQEKRKPPVIRREQPSVPSQKDRSSQPMRRMPVPAPRPQRPGQPPAPVFRRPSAAQPPRRPMPSPAPAQRRMPPPVSFPPARPAAAPVSAAPAVPIATPTVQPVASAPAVSPSAARPQAVVAASIHRWLTPQTLRSQFILTEVFQPPLALREQN